MFFFEKKDAGKKQDKPEMKGYQVHGKPVCGYVLVEQLSTIRTLKHIKSLCHWF